MKNLLAGATSLLIASLLIASLTWADEPWPQATGDKLLADYFRAETTALANRCLANIASLDDWTPRRDEYRRQLAEMLGLDPLPPRTDLKPVVTGKHETEWFTVENLHFQSRRGLYVTANLYVPKGLQQAAPAILYVCGHALVKKHGVSYGNKTSYQHHGGWYARNGYVCLTIDTLQLGEIEGLHHGTYREGMWWWNSRGYTPAGVEAWNCIRALDYLQSRPEVDGQRLGVTGRSGGGAYTWWIAALDERIKAAVPTAGITDLANHVVDGCVEGHCDCMFMVNTYRWDYPQVAALVAPRALLIANTDSDGIFPLDGVERLHAKVRRIYRLHGADEKLGLQISSGGHKDLQELQVAEFRWFNRFLKGDADALIENTGIRYFTPEELQVFRDGLPADQINTCIHELFVPEANSSLEGARQEDAARQRDDWMTALKTKCFHGWPEEPCPLDVRKVASRDFDGLTAEAWDFDSQQQVPLRLYLARKVSSPVPHRLDVYVGASNSLGREAIAAWRELLPDDFTDADFPAAKSAGPENAAGVTVLVLPRGFGRMRFSGDAKKQVQIRRRFMLLGQTLAGMQVWDVRRALEALAEIPVCRHAREVTLHGDGEFSVAALYASLFAPRQLSLSLTSLPLSDAQQPDVLNVRRFLGIPQLLDLAASKGAAIEVFQSDPLAYDLTSGIVKKLNASRITVQRGATETAPPP